MKRNLLSNLLELSPLGSSVIQIDLIRTNHTQIQSYVNFCKYALCTEPQAKMNVFLTLFAHSLRP